MKRWRVLGAVVAAAALACEGADSPTMTRGEATVEGIAAPPAADVSAPAAGPVGYARARPQVEEQQGRTPQPGAGPQADPAAPSMIIRTGSATVEVDSLEPAIDQVRALAERVRGYVANTSIHTGRRQMRSATLELKVPVARFDDAIGGLRPIGKLEAVTVSAQDVSEEYVDVGARVANARRLEERLVQLLATRTGKLEDVLAVERELARVREEIERYEGRLRFLRTRAALSTLSVTVHEPAPIVGTYQGANVIGQSFRTAWRNFVSFMAALIASLGILVPLALLALVGWLLVRRFIRWRPGGGFGGGGTIQP